MAHTCHATGCDREVPVAMWGCRRHWGMVPKVIRDRVWRNYRRGQEDDWRPSRDYLIAARDAVVAVAKLEELKPDTRIYDAFLGQV